MDVENDDYISLNAGSELDGEEPIAHVDGVFKDPTYGDIPDLEGDIKLIVAQEDQYADLVDLANAIEQVGGMSQEYALEAERLYPNVLGGRNINYYSKSPSATMFRTALEEITKGTWALIAAAVAACIGIIIKLIKWFTGKSGGENGVEKLGVRMDDAAETASNISGTLDSVQNEKVGEGETTKQVITRLAKDKNSMVWKFLTQDMTAGVYEMLSKGHFYKDIHELSAQLHQLEPIPGSKAISLDKVINRDMHGSDVTTEGVNVTEAKVIKEPISARLKGKVEPITDIANSIVKEWHDLNISRALPGTDFLKVMNQLEVFYKDPPFAKQIEDANKTKDHLEKVKGALEKIQSEIGTEETDGEAGRPSSEYGSEVRGMISLVLREQAALTRINGMMIDIFKAIESVTNRAQSVAEDLFKEMRKLAKENGVELSPALSAAEKKIKDAPKTKGGFWDRVKGK